MVGEMQTAFNLTLMGFAISAPILRIPGVGWVKCNGTHQSTRRYNYHLEIELELASTTQHILKNPLTDHIRLGMLPFMSS